MKAKIDYSNIKERSHSFESVLLSSDGSFNKYKEEYGSQLQTISSNSDGFLDSIITELEIVVQKAENAVTQLDDVNSSVWNVANVWEDSDRTQNEKDIAIEKLLTIHSAIVGDDNGVPMYSGENIKDSTGSSGWVDEETSSAVLTMSGTGAVTFAATSNASFGGSSKSPSSNKKTSAKSSSSKSSGIKMKSKTTVGKTTEAITSVDVTPETIGSALTAAISSGKLTPKPVIATPTTPAIPVPSAEQSTVQQEVSTPSTAEKLEVSTTNYNSPAPRESASTYTNSYAANENNSRDIPNNLENTSPSEGIPILEDSNKTTITPDDFPETPEDDMDSSTTPSNPHISSNSGSAIIPGILGVAAAGGAAVVGTRYLKKKNEENSGDIEEENSFSYLGDYQSSDDISSGEDLYNATLKNNKSTENGFGNLDEALNESKKQEEDDFKYKAGTVNKLVLDNDVSEIKIALEDEKRDINEG